MAKQQVENFVGDALKAVVEMDSDLKRDLRAVKDKIKGGITEVIKQLHVYELSDKVTQDLGTLKQKIKRLGDDGEVNGLVSGQLAELNDQKTDLDRLAGNTGRIKTEMDNLTTHFEREIKTPLNERVKAVDSAIETLGGKFKELNSDEQKKLEKIFEHIKDRVAAIKGTAGNGSWDNSGGQGLEGIKSKVESYFNNFTGSNGTMFNQIVKGWIEETILPYNGALLRMLGKSPAYKKDGDSNITNVANAFKEQLENDATAAGKKVVDGNNGADGDAQKIHAYVNAVKQGCDAFADALDKKLHNNGFSGIYSEVKQKMQDNSFKPTKCICESVGCANCGWNSHGTDCKEKAFLAAVLCTLSSVSRQVGNELNSVLLAGEKENSIAGILDAVYEKTREFHNQLDQATTPDPPTDPPESPAQAVDGKLEAVRDFVGKDKLTGIF
ncbi:Extracellular matrix-binding ebh, putative [Babesia ovata]|uniref:Extracellular matrix-binding ebh, putative n=1 Tax=Babesia ovata TaxID=189622 RepID=A0A2H6KBG0_9APIC|nr:Extracellular matrix-binding ebh, putative [Babesia ovata]GBE60299.1 Extracellular matrix-binding ebh, putative [Babesia ovata]